MALFSKKVAPLPGSFMITSIAGFLIAIYLIKDISWKFTFLIFFAVMFISAFISMTKSPVPDKKVK